MWWEEATEWFCARDTVSCSQQMTLGDGMVSPPSDDPILAIVVRDCWTQSISDSGQGLSDFEMMQLVLLSASIRTQDPGGPEVPVPPQRSGKVAHRERHEDDSGRDGTI